MHKTAEAVSLGHPDKIADYISCYILDRMIEQDPAVKYAVEVMIKDNTVVLGGEVAGDVTLVAAADYVRDALAEIGYTNAYAKIWGADSIEPDKIRVINLVGRQSADIARGVMNDGWGDQGVFVGYACRGAGRINRELYLARKLNNAIYNAARRDGRLGLDIKTQITLCDDEIETAIVAVPMREQTDITGLITDALGQRPKNIIVNGTGEYTRHASIADCGVTGRKLACDFYSTACPVGGGSPWTKDPTKADLTLNLYARWMAVEKLGENDECFVYLSSCIGRAELPGGLIKTIKDGHATYRDLLCRMSPKNLIETMGLNRPIYTKLCRETISGYFE